MVDAIRDTRQYFATHRSWMGEPDELWDLANKLRNLRTKTYSQTEYDQVERDLQALMTRFDRLSTGWAQVEWRQTPDPVATLTKGITKSRGDIYWDSRMLSLRNRNNLREFVGRLFKRFVDYGFRYNANVGGVNQFLGTDEEARTYGLLSDPMSLDRHGSCITLAFSFANLLQSFGVKASAKWVVAQDRTFISKVAHFIDPSVHGNLEYMGLLKPGYFVFTGHAATKIEGLAELFDPMAKARYTTPDIECYLQKRQDNDRVFEIQGNCRTLNISAREYRVVADPTRRTGGLVYYKLERKQA